MLLLIAMPHEQALAPFHPLIRRWFTSRYGAPTDVQARAWPPIAAGQHVLITAPTGSGKTLSAFLWSIDRLVSGTWSGGTVRVLYVSPLKALNNDIRRNLLSPLAELEAVFRDEGEPFPNLRVLTRSGDTPQNERQRMRRKPPEILITTPESLNLMLSSSSREIFGGLAAVILDEIHTIAAGKRGTYLMTAVERLVPISGEFQRIALSATVRPLEGVAAFVGGFVAERRGGEYAREARPVTVVQSESCKAIDLRIRFPVGALPNDTIELVRDGGISLSDSWWGALVDEFKCIIARNRSTLFFANTRRHAEKITLLINEGETKELAYSHHGSLSKEIRSVVEQRLKDGELAAIVATSSLELGIDIGSLDEVVLVQTPPTVAGSLQRIGRAGHSVGETSRGELFPLFGRDFLEAAVMAQAVLERDIEPIHPVQCPLDVLAQVIISMTGMEEWDVDELYAFFRATAPFAALSRRQFDSVLEMLAGRYADSRIRELSPRVSIDRIENTVKAKDGALTLIYHSGGTIPDRGYYSLRVADSKAKIGELDEEFVWERSLGDVFTLGAQSWKITRIDHQNVEVTPWNKPGGFVPFWRAERRHREFSFSARLGEFLEHWNRRVDTPEFLDAAERAHCMDRAAAEELARFLTLQRETTEADLPHRHHLLIEHFHDPLNTSDSRQVVLHTLWGGRVNVPMSLALAAAWEDRFGYPLETFPDNDAILLLLPHDVDPAGLTALLSEMTQVTAGGLERLLRRKLEGTGFFGARFRENAGRALLLPRSSFKRRMPLWLNRLRSKKLLDAVQRYEDFPVLLETWRTCLQDEFDLDSLRMVLDEVHTGAIRISECVTRAPSPFAGGLVWQQTNLHMYQGDEPQQSRSSGLSEEVMKEVLFSPQLRPHLPDALVRDFQGKVQRTARGYAPRTGQEVIDWAKERLLIPEHEWETLVAAATTESDEGPDALMRPLGTRLCRLFLPNAAAPSVAALEMVPRVLDGMGLSRESVRIDPTAHLEGAEQAAYRRAVERSFQIAASDEEARPQTDAGDLVAEWLRYYGPIEPAAVAAVFGLSADDCETLLAELAEQGTVIIDRLREGTDTREVCDTENLEFLLRLSRAGARPTVTALSADHLPLFLAARQGLTRRGERVEDLEEALERLFGYIAPAELWETDYIPARMGTYYARWLDDLLRDTDLIWFGAAKRRIGFSFVQDLELFVEPTPEAAEQARRLVPDTRGAFSFWDIQDHIEGDSATAARRVWDCAFSGTVSADAYEPVRRGVATKFGEEATANRPRGDERRSHLRRQLRGRSYRRWKSERPERGNWFVLPVEPAERDALEREELAKDRIRQLLLRYGVLFRELLANESDAFQWSALFRALRIMELSGEITSGHFFEGVSGPQFISSDALRLFLSYNEEASAFSADSVYWCNATDPASVCGAGLPELSYRPPSRIPGNHLVYHGTTLVLVSRRLGKELHVHAPPDCPDLPRYLAFFRDLAGRDYRPLSGIRVETVNDEPVRTSAYADALVSFGFLRDYRAFTLPSTYR